MRLYFAIALLLLLALAGCSTYEPLSTQSIEEGYLGQGYANKMYRYGVKLESDGRLEEAHSAYLAAEENAHTQDLRTLARRKRIYLEQVITAYERGEEPPAPAHFTRIEPVAPESAAPSGGTTASDLTQDLEEAPAQPATLADSQPYVARPVLPEPPASGPRETPLSQPPLLPVPPSTPN